MSVSANGANNTWSFGLMIQTANRYAHSSVEMLDG